MNALACFLLLLTWRTAVCDRNSTDYESESQIDDGGNSYLPEQDNEDVQYDSGWTPMTSTDPVPKSSTYESSSPKTLQSSYENTQANVPLLDGILPFGSQLLSQGSALTYPTGSYRSALPSQTGSLNYYPAATANIPLGYSLTFGNGLQGLGGGSAANYLVAPEKGNYIYGGTKLTHIPGDASSGASNQNYKGAVPQTTEHRIKITTQDFALPFLKNSAMYGNSYSPTTQKLSVSEPGSYYFGATLPQNYNFNPSASYTNLQQSSPSTLSTNTTNSQYGQYPSINVAATSPVSFSNTPTYNGALFSANSYPTFTGQQVFSPYQFSANNLFKNTAVPTSFSTGIYHNQPTLQNNQQLQHPFSQPFSLGLNPSFQPIHNFQQTNLHQRPQPQNVITGSPKHTKPISYVKNTNNPTRYSSYSSSEKPNTKHNYNSYSSSEKPNAKYNYNSYSSSEKPNAKYNYNSYSSSENPNAKYNYNSYSSTEKPSTKYSSQYHRPSKYNSEDDSDSHRPYKTDEEDEDSERYTSSHNDDYHDDDKDSFEDTFDVSEFPSASNFFKNSKPFQKSFFTDGDSTHSSTSNFPKAPKPTPPRYTNKKYNSEPYRSSSSYSERGTKYDEDDDDRSHRYSSKSPSSKYQSNSRADSKPETENPDPPSLFRPYKYKPPSYADEKSTEFLGKPGPVKLTYQDKLYEREFGKKDDDGDDDDSNGEHSEHSPQSVKQAITTEDKKSDYYSYTFTKRKIMQ